MYTRIHPLAMLLFRFMVQRTRHINVDVLVLQRFVSFLGLKNEAYACVLSLFRRALVTFHSFTVLISTHGFKNELCHSRSVLVSTRFRGTQRLFSVKYLFGEASIA